MNIVAINGSPKSKNSNTHLMIEAMLSAEQEKSKSLLGKSIIEF
ncbi:NAD(P)H-dependent oxidoreductase [bacterium]|nr:NAD(P)H-dependent oxidoreductase [bacterium]MBU1064369.1 NAD(P)H-dependent oxidoreductase [bacterium]MBU1634440.1 NAD(P)H-dependent oxidoreductase [bacterium]MBU1874598.1 NAD(P)H-dependent oxidoreductase [bacterium]